jgi:hypothetical protein
LVTGAIEVVRMRISSFAISASLLCLATTCDEPVRIDVSGDLETAVVFRTFVGDKDPRVHADEVVVGELYGDEIWRLEGSALVRELVYGAPVDGMTSKVGPQPLERGKDYYVVVKGGVRSRGGHYGTASFSVGKDGHVGPGTPIQLPDLEP